MVKTKIVETTEKFDKDGNVVEKIMREETTEDDTDYTPVQCYMPEGRTLANVVGKCSARNSIGLSCTE